MQALLQHATVGDQATPVANRADQPLKGVVGDRSSGALASQPDQRRAVAVVGLGAARPELRTGCLRL
jgi:hypothetical protein